MFYNEICVLYIFIALHIGYPWEMIDHATRSHLHLYKFKSIQCFHCD